MICAFLTFLDIALVTAGPATGRQTPNAPTAAKSPGPTRIT
jgi:hypothetical protein